MKTIAITDIPGIRIGQVENAEGATGVTVIVAENRVAAGVDVRGGGPASRDSRTLDPLAAAEQIDAVVLAGGSAYGLDAAGGVMRCLEERGMGLPVGDAVVPLVCQSDIFDLLVGENVRPDAQMGHDACAAAFEGEAGNYRDGNFGAGCGATVGKALGGDFCMKSGIGSYAVQLGELQVGAIVVVNALGDVRDNAGETIAGLLDDDRTSFRDTETVMFAAYEAGALAADAGDGMPTNTTIGAVITNAALPKAQLCKVAGMAHDGMARAIRPVHTSMDGDTIYALSVGNVDANLDLVGTLAAHVVARAIECAVTSAEGAYGLPCARDLEK